jgi:type IV pilus assembly protein PilY1
LEPVEGNNTFFVASYNTVTWDGELKAKTIDPGTGDVSDTPTWAAAGLLDSKIASNGLSDTRTIYTSNATSLISFDYSNLSTTQKAYFNNNQLSQYGDWSASQITDGTPENLLKYIRGQNRYEDQERDTNSYGAYSRLYRDRPTTLGDIVHAQPVYVQAPPYSFADSGYEAFKTSQADRAPTVYVSANDGMLHAFDAETGKERWAYVPPIVMPNLWRLADANYTNNHRYFIDGPLTVADIDDGGTWKSILIGALGKGGRGYFALDITDPASPKYMWSFTADTNPNMGYSYGAATVTKVDGTWAVLLPSGYNNIPESGKYTSADGIGRLFLVNASSGNLIKEISTGSGSVSTPSGLAKINPRVQFFETDNTATLAYGGDLLGNLWRFDLLNGTVSKIIALGSNQPITVAPEIADASGKTVLYFGTGRYLSQDDLTLDKQQAIYGIKDNGTSELTLGSLVEQTITSDKLSTNTVDWNVNGGWFINLIKEKERVALEAKLVLGTLIVASIVPLNTECTPKGEGRLYFIDYFSGGNVDNGQSVYTYDSPIVGMSAIRTEDGIKMIPVTADGGIGSPRKVPTKPPGGGGAESGRRLMWRELVE